MSLFKKGEKTAPKPKKALFGKKASDNDAVDEAIVPKKTGFSLTKKRTSDDEPAPKAGKKPAKAKGGGLDTSKLIPILGGLLVAAVLGLAAKMFLFAEPEPEPVVPTLPPPTTPKPAPAQADATAQPAQPNANAQAAAPQATPAQGQPVANAQANAQALPQAQAPAELPVQPVQPAQAQQATPAQPVAPDAGAVAPAQPQVATPQNFTREEFLRESKNKIYRERETTQPNP